MTTQTDGNADKPLVLVVDDFQDNREMYCEYLEFAGFRVIEAANGQEAVDQAFEKLPDVIIMDPPRTGAYDLMEPLVRLRPHNVIYVSCDPSTLMRDLQLVVAGGYKVRRVRAFDFFPNTHHVEVVANVLLT